MTPSTAGTVYTHPASVGQEISALVGDYSVDVRGFRTGNKTWLREQIFSMTRKHFDVVRHYLQNAEWDYFHFVEIGLDRLQHGFWKYHDPDHVQYEARNPFERVIADYYLYLDQEIGQILSLLDDDTAVLVLSDYGAQRLDGEFCINEWLLQEGYLDLDRYPSEVTPFNELNVNWARTRVWGEGGYCSRIFLNVKGRDPLGTVEPSEYEKVRDEVSVKLESLVGEDGKPFGAKVLKPEELYRSVRKTAPDLIVCFGGLHWRSVGSVGYPTLFVREGDGGLDSCSHAEYGAFVLAAPNNPVAGEVEGASLLDMAPTLLEIAGHEIPPSMQGKSLLGGHLSGPDDSIGLSEDEEAILRERLSGLGYIS